MCTSVAHRLRYTGAGMSYWTLWAGIVGHLRPYANKGRILLANLLQGSRSTFSCASFPSVFAFQEGMWDTHISALLGSPTVSGRFHWRHRRYPDRRGREPNHKAWGRITEWLPHPEA